MAHPEIERIERIIGQVAEGGVVRSAITEAGIQPKVFWDAVALDSEIQAKYAVALQCRAMLLVDDMRVIADTETNAHRARNRIEVRKWEASKLDPHKWGDTLRLDINQTIDIGQAMLEARQRVLPASDQRQVIDAEYTEESSTSQANTIDKQSVEPAKEIEKPMPDLFD